MARSDADRINGPCTLICWCETVQRSGWDWRQRAENLRHSLSFEPDDEFPDGEFAPCPVKSCTGRVRLRGPGWDKKKKKKKRTTKRR
jgi:hypothetical protein